MEIEGVQVIEVEEDHLEQEILEVEVGLVVGEILEVVVEEVLAVDRVEEDTERDI